MSNLKPLFWDWSYGDGGKTRAVCRAKSPSHEYIVRMGDKADVYYVDYRKFDNDEDSDNRKDEPPVFSSVGTAQDWAQSTHYPSKMQPYVKPDSITDIANWFKAAKPEPTDEDLSVQIGCCLEEVCELLEGLGAQTGHYRELTDLANEFKYKGEWALKRVRNLTYQQRIDIADACCDINVTSVGVMQLLGGVDVLGAQREVIRSNNSKMVKGKFIFDDNGKIQKPESYSEPDLTPFVKQGE